jgi:ATP-dependent RNA circularization protein (DNA/RNA ligase family)
MENFITYHKIKRLGDEENKEIFTNPEDEIIIQEKIDGGNFRFALLNGKLIFGSRTQQLTNDEGEDTNLNKNFRRCVEFVRSKFVQCPISDLNLIFFGECCVKHTITYDWDKIPPFLGFDIYNIKEERYLDYKECYEIYTLIGLPMVPLVWKGKVKELPKFLEECKNGR